MRTRVVLAALLAFGTASAQPPDAAAPRVSPVPLTTRPEKSLDELLDQLDALRNQKAEIDRQEQEVVKQIRAKLVKQDERLRKFGLTTGPVPPELPVVPAAAAVPPAFVPYVAPMVVLPAPGATVPPLVLPSNPGVLPGFPPLAPSVVR